MVLGEGQQQCNGILDLQLCTDVKAHSNPLHSSQESLRNYSSQKSLKKRMCLKNTECTQLNMFHYVMAAYTVLINVEHDTSPLAYFLNFIHSCKSIENKALSQSVIHLKEKRLLSLTR